MNRTTSFINYLLIILFRKEEKDLMKIFPFTSASIYVIINSGKG